MSDQRLAKAFLTDFGEAGAADAQAADARAPPAEAIGQRWLSQVSRVLLSGDALLSPLHLARRETVLPCVRCVRVRSAQGCVTRAWSSQLPADRSPTRKSARVSEVAVRRETNSGDLVNARRRVECGRLAPTSAVLRIEHTRLLCLRESRISADSRARVRCGPRALITPYIVWPYGMSYALILFWKGGVWRAWSVEAPTEGGGAILFPRWSCFIFSSRRTIGR